MNNPIIIREVTTTRLRRQFIDFPVKLYKDNPYFTPYIFEDEMVNLDQKKNPARAYCDWKLFLAYQDKKIVGRICAWINHYSNKKYNQKYIRFNRIDMVDDLDVTKALIGAVEAYGKENGLTHITGPLGYSDQDKEGLLTKGFEEKNMFVTFYTHEYYVHHLEKLGFKVDVTWDEFKVMMPKSIDPRYEKLANYVAKKYQVRLLEFKKKKNKLLLPYVHQVFSLTNRAYDHLHGYVPIPENLMDELGRQYLSLLNIDYLQVVVDKNDKVVAFGIAIPTPVDALKKAKGHLFPFGFIRVLKALKKSKVLDMLLVAVEPELQQSGIISLILYGMLKKAMQNKIIYAETGPELFNNADVQSLWKGFEKIKHKERACFLKVIN